VFITIANPAYAVQSNLPLDRAARAGDVAEVKRLLDQGADPNEVNKWGTTALTGACTLGADSPAHTEIVRYLISHGAHVNKRVADGTTALNEASYWRHREIVVALLNAKAAVNQAKDNGYTPLIAAASQGHTSIVRLLIAAGADLNRQTRAGLTALHMASSNGHADVVKLLIAAGAQTDLMTEARRSEMSGQHKKATAPPTPRRWCKEGGVHLEGAL